MTTSACPALFLDRDGVVNIDHGYVWKKEDFHFNPHIFELCRAAKAKGFLLFIITNQSGIGRGYYSERDFHDLTRWMCDIFFKEGAGIDKVYYCPFHSTHGKGEYKRESVNRKPSPGMLLEAAQEFNVDLPGSILVGDKTSDVQAGINAGVRRNYLYARNPPHQVPYEISSANVVSSLREIVI